MLTIIVHLFCFQLAGVRMAVAEPVILSMEYQLYVKRQKNTKEKSAALVPVGVVQQGITVPMITEKQKTVRKKYYLLTLLLPSHHYMQLPSPFLPQNGPQKMWHVARFVLLGLRVITVAS